MRPANRPGNGYQAAKNDEEYLPVDIAVRCLPDGESCQLTAVDCGARSASGREIPAELSSPFEGGELDPRQHRAGSLVFIVRKSDSDLVLFYPRLFFGLSDSAEFVLGK